MRRVLRHLLQGGGDDLLDLVQQDRRRPAGPRLVDQARPAACRVNRPRHRATMCAPTPNSAATALLSLPSAQARTIFARSASA